MNERKRLWKSKHTVASFGDTVVHDKQSIPLLCNTPPPKVDLCLSAMQIVTSPLKKFNFRSTGHAGFKSGLLACLLWLFDYLAQCTSLHKRKPGEKKCGLSLWQIYGICIPFQ